MFSTHYSYSTLCSRIDAIWALSESEGFAGGRDMASAPGSTFCSASWLQAESNRHRLRSQRCGFQLRSVGTDCIVGPSVIGASAILFLGSGQLGISFRRITKQTCAATWRSHHISHTDSDVIRSTYQVLGSDPQDSPITRSQRRGKFSRELRDV